MGLDKLMRNEIERNKIQKMMDDFCELTGLAAVVNDTTGNKLSDLVNVSAYCKEMRAKDDLCCLSDHKGATVAVNIGETCIYICHAGVVDFAIPLIVEGEYVGSIMAGQVRTEEKLPFDFTTESTKAWMANKALYEKYLLLPLMDKEQIQRSANVLEIMRSYIVQRIVNLRVKETESSSIDKKNIEEKVADQLRGVVVAIERLDYSLGRERLDKVMMIIKKGRTPIMSYGQLVESLKQALEPLSLPLISDQALALYDDFNKWGTSPTENKVYGLYEWAFEQVLMKKYCRVKDELDYAVAYIQRYYYKKLSASEVADYMNLSPDYFSRRFKKRFGMSYSEYLNLHRLKIAKILLRDTDESIQWVAFATGFTDAAYFTRVFKKHVFLSPTAYRQNC